MTVFALKAAGRSPEQLADRAAQCSTAGIPAAIELHLGSLDDLSRPDEIAANCLAHPGCRWSVHFPLFDQGRRWIFDMATTADEDIRRACGLCVRIGARELVVHRTWGLGGDRDGAECSFLEAARRWTAISRREGVRIIYENNGFFWLPASMGGGFQTGPLDHFFPWDMRRFREAQGGAWAHVGIALDLAHAVLSVNMFNMLQAHPQLGGDPRFANIRGADLAQAGRLSLADFLLDFIDYLHVSDALVWREYDGLQGLDAHLKSEGMPLGDGNIDYRTLAPRLLSGTKILVMEIEPPDGDHRRNSSQGRAVSRLLDLAAQGGTQRVPDHR